MQPLHKRVAPHSLPEIPLVSRANTTPEHPVKGTHHMINNRDAASPLPTPKFSVVAQELLALLDKINVEMTDEIARVTAAISKVEDNVKLLRFDRMKAACIRSAIYLPSPEDEESNIMQIL